MKNVRFWLFLGLLIPCGALGANGSDFQSAAQLLSAARRGDIQTVQYLINSGVDINYTDSTGLSLVCTAVMNNDKRAIQILQMYGADASNCDNQIKQYRRRKNVAANGEEYDFFSGLSSSHIVVLSALGVAGVIGGIALLTDAFDSENNNGTSSSGGTRPGGGGGDSSSSSLTKLFTMNLPEGPGENCSGSSCDYSDWESGGAYGADFDYMSINGFNYLMASHAYDAFVRGYLGMYTIRLTNDKAPFDLSSLPFTDIPGGGKPFNVAMITSSGVNAVGSASDGFIEWIDYAQISNVQSKCKTYGNTSEQCRNALTDALDTTTHKYFNYSGTAVAETEGTDYDLSGSGTVFGLATDSDTKLAKVIAGWNYGERASADYIGFIPNGQLLVYKTGGGKVWDDAASAGSGTYNISGTELAVNDRFNLFGKTLTVKSVVRDSAGGWVFVATDSDDNEYKGYLKYNGGIIGSSLYISSEPNGDIDQMYSMGNSNALTLTKEVSATPADYKNFYAINSALRLSDSGNNVTNVVANLSLPAASVGLDYATVTGAKAEYEETVKVSEALAKTTYGILINNYYNLNTDDDASVNTPAADAELAYSYLGNYQKQILVNPAGHNRYGYLSAGASLASQPATFENFAPVVYPDLENLFMTVVAVEPANGTYDVSIDEYSAEDAGTLRLSRWYDENDSSIEYSSRICGLAGNGNYGSMNPWCFAAPGDTDLDATAAMAGAVALVQSAFQDSQYNAKPYATPKQIFLLLALTADGPYLGTNPESTKAEGWTDEALITYLKKMYTLPAEFDTSDENYLDSFKQVFGYGVINLERATRPGTNVYFYDSDKNTIVSSAGKSAYWRSATNTSSRASSVLSLTGRGAIRTSFYDVLESNDGTLSLPRVWNSTIAADTSESKYGLYMGDVLGDFDIDSTNKRTSKVGNLTIDMAISSRAYNDNMNGLDDMRVTFSNEKFDLATEYQHHLTDGESRFNGRANGLLNLVSNSISMDATYKHGHFGFGGRAFIGAITDENLVDTDPVVSSQYEPGRLGLVNGGAMDAKYNNDVFGLNMSFGVMHEDNTVLGMVSDGLLALNGADTKYVDAIATYKPFDDVKLSLRGTYAITDAVANGLFISDMSNMKSNSFAFGLDVGGFGFTAAMPLAVVDGKMGYGYADFEVVENNDKYEIAMNNAHTEYVDLSAVKRELRFTTTYKQSIGAFTDAGVGFIYRVNPNNTDAFGNESIFMFKVHHRLGI